jgi:hypothetical protein
MTSIEEGDVRGLDVSIRRCLHVLEFGWFLERAFACQSLVFRSYILSLQFATLDLS